jgi:RimJ/RimL family protein N-acetyltransferase
VPDASADVGGLVLLQRLAPKSRAAMLSFVFSEAHWKTEVPAVSSACVLAFAFEAVGVDRVEGRAGGHRELENVRRLDAAIEGVLRQSQPVGDRFADQILWSVLATDWVRPDHSASNLLVRVEQEHPLPGGPAGGGDVERPGWTVRLPTLEGSVVTLREIDQLDVPALIDTLEPADLKVAFEPAPTTPEEFRRYVSWIQLQRTEGRAAGFAIVPRGARQAAGLLQVRRADFPGAVAEWGIVLASSHRGTGAASEAARLAAEFAFETLGVHRLETRASGISEGSIRLLGKLGAVREAHLRQSFVHGGEVLDDDLWAILKSDWRASHTGSGGR